MVYMSATTGIRTARIRVILELRLGYLLRSAVVWTTLALAKGGGATGSRTLEFLDVALRCCHTEYAQDDERWRAMFE
jgi:hypothetical protein